jgi:hypothetical protein
VNKKSSNLETGQMSVLSVHNLDIYIKECLDCAQTCRVCAEAHINNANKYSKYIDACLECAKTCEATAKALLLHKNGIKTIQPTRLEACAIACKVCWQICKKLGEHDSFAVCAEYAQRCEEILHALIRSTSPKTSARVVTFLNFFAKKKVAL